MNQMMFDETLEMVARLAAAFLHNTESIEETRNAIPDLIQLAEDIINAVDQRYPAPNQTATEDL